MAAPAANAVTYTWTGTDGPFWFNGGSWQGNAAPPLDGLTTSDLVFGSGAFSATSIGGAYSIRSLSFNAGASAYTFGSGSLTLGAGGLAHNAAIAQAFSTAQVLLGADQTWTLASGAGPLSFVAGLNTAGGGTGRTLTINAATATGSGNVINGVISGSGSLTKLGAGILTLTGANTYTGATTFAAGALNVGSAGALGGTGPLSFSGGTLQHSAANQTDYSARFSTAAGQAYSFDTNGQNVSLATGLTSAGGTLSKTGAGTLALTGASSYTGNTFVSAGTLAISGSVGTNGSLFVDGTAAGAASVNLGGSAGSLSVAFVSVGGDGNGTFNQSGGRHITGTLSLAGSSTSSQGTYNLNGGTLVVGSIKSGGVGGNSIFNFNGGTLQAGAANASLLQGLTTANVQAGGARVDTAGVDVTIAQALVHDTTTGAAALDGGLTKIGAGTLTLAGANTFNGALNIAAGTLAVAAESNLGGSSNVTVGGSGALLFTASTTLARTYNLGVSTLATGSGNTLTLGNSAIINGGFLNGPGTTALGSGSTLNGVTAFAGSTLMQAGGAATINGSTIRGAFTQAGGTMTANNVFVSGSGRLNVGGTLNTAGTEIQGVTTISSGGMLANSGSSLYLTGGSRTTVNSGGTLATATGTTIELNGSQLVNNGTQRGVLDINFGSLAKGSGSFGTINIADGGKFSPGNSPGTATAENFTFGAGGRYDFELNTANPRVGIDSDLLVVTDTLFISAGTTPNSVFTIGVVSLNQANQPAALTDFDSSRAYHYLLVDASTVSGFASAKFNVDTSGFFNSLNGGRFSVSLNGNDVYLDFMPMPVPEPASWAMWLAAAAAGAGLRARRRRTSQS